MFYMHASFEKLTNIPLKCLRQRNTNTLQGLCYCGFYCSFYDGGEAVLFVLVCFSLSGQDRKTQILEYLKNLQSFNTSS